MLVLPRNRWHPSDTAPRSDRCPVNELSDWEGKCVEKSDWGTWYGGLFENAKGLMVQGTRGNRGNRPKGRNLWNHRTQKGKRERNKIRLESGHMCYCSTYDRTGDGRLPWMFLLSAGGCSRSSGSAPDGTSGPSPPRTVHWWHLDTANKRIHGSRGSVFRRAVSRCARRSCFRWKRLRTTEKRRAIDIKKEDTPSMGS